MELFPRLGGPESLGTGGRLSLKSSLKLSSAQGILRGQVSTSVKGGPIYSPGEAPRVSKHGGVHMLSFCPDPPGPDSHCPISLERPHIQGSPSLHLTSVSLVELELEISRPPTKEPS